MSHDINSKAQKCKEGCRLGQVESFASKDKGRLRASAKVANRPVLREGRLGMSAGNVYF